MSIPEWLRRSWLAQGLDTFLLSSSLTCCVLDGSWKLCPSGIFPSSIFRWCTWEIATPPDPFVFSRNLLPRKCGRCFRIFRRSAKRTEMEWIEVCIYIEVVHVFYPLQGFDQGDSHWKSSDFPRAHNCPAGKRYFEHFTQRKSARKRHCDECHTVDQLAQGRRNHKPPGHPLADSSYLVLGQHIGIREFTDEVCNQGRGSNPRNGP